MTIKFPFTRGSAPVIPDDLATKKYVDAQIGGSPLTTKGDLFGFDSANARIPIGTDTQILTADSGEALGLKWAAPASGSGEANTSSNSGSGEGLALAKDVVDLPFKSLKATAPIVIASDSNSVTYSLSATGDLGTPSAIVLTNATGLPEAGLLDNAVTLAKMAHGTDGNLITYSATGAPAFVTTGTSGQVLTSNGAGTAPTFQAGGGGGGGFDTVYKTADETIINDSTLTDDTDLSGITLDASSTYAVWAMIHVFDETSTPDYKHAFTVPAGATIIGNQRSNKFYSGNLSASSYDTGDMTVSASGTGITNKTGYFLIMGIIITDTTAGVLDYQWAQATSDANDTILRQGSWIATKKLS